MPTYCEPCGLRREPVEAIEEVEGVPMCKPCSGQAQREMERAGLTPTVRELVRPSNPRPVSMCAQGCGRPVHRGRCAGYRPGPRQAKAEIPQLAAVPPVRSEEMDIPVRRKSTTPAPVAEPKKRGAMDTLDFEIVRDEDVPRAASGLLPKRMGRLGQIWEQLEKLAPGQTLKVKNRDRDHLGYTRTHLQKGAKKQGFRLRVSAHGTDLYLRRLREGEAEEAAQ